MKPNQKKLLFLITSGIILLANGYLAWKFNREIFFHINGLYKETLGYPMLFLTAMADGLFVLMISALAYQKKRGYYWSFITAYIVSALIVQIIKNTYSSGRPLAYYPIDQIYYTGKILMFQSFPSGHSSAALVLATYLAQGAKIQFSVLFYTLGILCAISRVYIGAHFPVDVVAGASIGFFTGQVIFWIAEKKYKHANRPEYKYNELLISFTGGVAALFYLFFNNDLYAPLSITINSVALLFLIYFMYNVVTIFLNIYRNKSPAN